MKLIKQLNANLADRAAVLKEDGTGAGGVAGAAMPLFAKLIKRTKKVSDKPQAPAIVPATKSGLGLAEAFKHLREFEGEEPSAGAQTPQSKFDSTEVLAKLKGLEAKEKQDHRDTVTFGLEDEDGGIVRVTVKTEQAEDFEQSLQAFMAAKEEEDDKVPEIAEVLFKLKDRFDIVDVQWPDVEQDEEQDVGLEGGAEDPNADPSMNPDDMGMDPNAAAPGGDTGQVTDLLTQVIDMMKADAEARKAEAHAREAEAKTKQADALVAQSMSRVKQEEQYLDMESFNKSKKDEEREAKRLAQLAKWKHDMGKQNGGGADDEDQLGQTLVPNTDAAPEEEEHTFRRPAPSRVQPTPKAPAVRGRVAPHDIASFIIDRVR